MCVTVMRADIVSRQVEFVLEQDANGKMFEKFRKKDKAKSLIEQNKKSKLKSTSKRRKFVKKNRKKNNG